jgi:hypothetical protein
MLQYSAQCEKWIMALRFEAPLRLIHHRAKVDGVDQASKESSKGKASKLGGAGAGILDLDRVCG